MNRRCIVAPSSWRLTLVLSASLMFSGCAVVTVAGAAAGAAISVAGAVVSTGVKVTGKVVEKTVDLVAGGNEEESGKKKAGE